MFVDVGTRSLNFSWNIGFIIFEKDVLGSFTVLSYVADVHNNILILDADIYDFQRME